MSNPNPLRASTLARSILAVLTATTTFMAGSAEATGSVRAAQSAPVASLASAPGSALLLRAGSFDPLAANLLLTEASLGYGADPRYGIVQFRSTRLPSESRIAATGAEVVAYLPHNAYLVRWNGGRAQIMAMSETRWTGPYLPGYKFDPALWATSNVQDLVLIGFPGTNADRFSAALEKSVPGLIRISRLEDPRQPRVNVRVPAALLRDALRAAAAIGDVLFIEAYSPPRLLNDDSYGPIQSNTASNTLLTTDTPIWNQGITGSGQIVTVADSGLDHNHCAFVQLDKGTGPTFALTSAVDSTPPLAAALHPNNKILGYWTQPGATAYDNSTACVSIGGVPSPTRFHGTHVVGSVLGDRGAASTPTNAGYDDSDAVNAKPGDGMAPNAQVLFQDIGHDQTGCLSGIGVLDDMFEQAHRGGARIHSNSWGAASAGVYTGRDADADFGLRNHEDMLVLFAAGNDGADPTSTGSPGNAKNVLTVGANAHGNAATIASFSSRGPTVDGRTKPELTAPGSGIYSAMGDNNDTEGLTQAVIEATQCASQSLSGTSMATPTVAGGAALMRQYFSDGFYPTGARVADDRYSPSGSLMKAVLMNGTSAPTSLPNNTFGWGRVWLDSNLYFPGDTRKLRHFDVPNAAGLETGEQHSYQISVPSTLPGQEKELRATLTWYDAPGTPAAATALVNNLDLEVVAPDNTTTYLGNVFTADASAIGGTSDIKNNTEVVRLKLAGSGAYTLRVKAAAVPGSGLEGSTRQGYALAVSHATCNSAVTQASAALVATDQGLVGVQLAFGAVPNAPTHQVYRAPGTCASADPSAFRLVGSTAGTSFLDANVTGGVDYAYTVRGVDACGEGPVSTCSSVLSTAACDLVPSFNVDDVVVSNDPVTGNVCGTKVTWTAGSSRCPSAPTVNYNVYRSTAFDFVPAPENLVATGVSGTQWHDPNVDPLTTYFYVVRAEDGTIHGAGPANNGNESTGLRRVNAVAHGPSAPGTYADSVDLAAFMTVQPQWSISNDRASDAPLSYRSAADNSAVYLPEQCAAVTTPPILLGAGSPSLSYDASYNIEDQWDGVVVEISNDGGGTWQDLPPSPAYPSTFAQTGANPANACGYLAVHGAFGGVSPGFATGAFVAQTSSLSSFANQTVKLRWRFSTDPAAEFEGFFLDKVRITGASMPGTCTRSSVDMPPTAVADTADVLEDALPTAINVLGNDTDPDGGPRTIDSVTQPANGAVAITGGGTGLTYAPNANFCSAGADTFNYTLNGGSSAQVGVTVGCVNDAPGFTKGANQSVNQDAGAQTVPNWATAISAGPANESGQTVSINVTGNTNAALFSAAPAVASDGTLTYTAAAGTSGTATITLIAQDNGGTASGGVDSSAAQTFEITVGAVNAPPSFTKGADQAVNEDAGAQSVPNWATAISPGPGSEAGQTVTFTVTGNTNAALFSAAPAVASDGTLSYTAAAHANGTATITLVAQDNGGTVNGGNDTSAPQSFDIAVGAVNDAPSFTKGSDQTVGEDAGPQIVPNWATAIIAGPANESDQAVSFKVTTNSNPALFSAGPEVSATGTLGYAIAAEANGTATITLTAKDSGGTTNGGVDTSAPESFTITATAVDDAPVAVADAATLAEDAAATAIPVLNNDTDVDGGTKSILATSQPANGTVAIIGAGTGLTYRPNANFCSATPDTFTYTLNGGSIATVSVTVTCVDDAPVAVADMATVSPNAAATPIAVLDNDTDVDGGTKSILATSQPANGTVAITGVGTGLTYRPNAGFCSATPDSFTYTLNGGSTATVSVSVPCGTLPNTIFSNGFEG